MLIIAIIGFIFLLMLIAGITTIAKVAAEHWETKAKQLQQDQKHRSAS